MLNIFLFCIILLVPLFIYGQSDQKHELDSAFIQRVEESVEPDKVLHAEPLCIDLIRDLGARKEKTNGTLEWA